MRAPVQRIGEVTGRRDTRRKAGGSRTQALPPRSLSHCEQHCGHAGDDIHQKLDDEVQFPRSIELLTLLSHSETSVLGLPMGKSSTYLHPPQNKKNTFLF